MPRSSFLIPVKHGERTIGDALRSFLQQTDPDFEVVVVNDGSTDRTSEVVQAVAAVDPRVRLFNRPWAGIVAAMNFGLQQCEGRYIARMDADDLTHPRRLELQLPWLEENPTLGVVDAEVELFRDDGQVPEGMGHYATWINSLHTPKDFDRELLVDSPIIHPAATYRKADVLQLGGYRDLSYPEDYDLWLRLHAAGFQFRKIDQVLHRMRDRPERLTRTDPRYSQEAMRGARQMWLQKTVLTQAKRVVVWGAGTEGKHWIRWLSALGHTLSAIVEVANRKIGGTRAGAPIIAASDLPSISADLCLVAVGARGARAEIRADLAHWRPDWCEGVHWWAVR